MTLSHFLLAFLRRHARHYAAAALMLLVVALLTVAIPRKVGQIIDALAAGTLSATALRSEVCVLLLMGLAIYFLRVGWRMQLFSASYQLGIALRTQLYQSLCRQNTQFFHSQRTGDLMALSTNDADAIEWVAGEAMLAGFDGSLTFALVIGMMLLGVDMRLALAALLPFPLMALAFVHITRKIHTASRAALNSFARLNEQVQQDMSGIRTVRALGLEDYSLRRYQEKVDAAARDSLSAQRWEAAYEPAVGLTLTSAAALCLGVGGTLVWQGTLSVGQLTSFTMYLGQLIWPMFAAGWVLALVERGRGAWTRLSIVLRAADSLQDQGRHDQPPDGALIFSGVTLRDAGRQEPTLQTIDLTLHPGQTLALVGPTGSGKSSVLRLLLRQAYSAAGQIDWGGIPLKAYPLARLRAATAWVGQEPFLLNASIRANLQLAAPEASEAQLTAAAQQACLHEDILRLAHGYDTEVGERGITLSGGQKQRLALARALLHDTTLLLLDDALSAVDNLTQTRILQALNARRRSHPHRMTILTSHRLATVREADCICVLQHGRISEFGTHAELLAKQGWYARQWHYQQLEESLDAA